MLTAQPKKRQPRFKANLGHNDNVDALADQLGSTLKLNSRPAKTAGNDKTKINPKTRAPEVKKNDASAHKRNINTSLQKLESALQSGWKATTSRRSGEFTLATLTAAATTGRASLNHLKKAGSSLIDLERAASSMISKLINMELFEQALYYLYDSHGNLSSLCNPDQTDRSSTNAPPKSISTVDPVVHLFLLSINHSPACSDLDPKLQSLIISYFLHSHAVVVHYVMPRASAHKALLKALTSTGSLLTWRRHLTTLPALTLDNSLKRAYVTLTSTLTSPPATAQVNFQCRLIGLKHLLFTSDLDANKFWKQTLHFTLSYLEKSSIYTEEEMNTRAREALEGFQMLKEAASSHGSKFEVGAGWMMFCEHWLALARRLGDVQTILQVSAHIRSTPSSSSDKLLANNQIDDVSRIGNDDELNPSEGLLALNLYAKLSEAAAIIESTSLGKPSINENEALSKLRDTNSYLEEHLTAARKSTVDPGSRKRLRFLLESLRRTCTKAICLSTLSVNFRNESKAVIESIVADIQLQLKASADDSASLKASALESLLALATSALQTSHLQTYDQAYNYLQLALTIANVSPEGSEDSLGLEVSNFIRCISGVFFNIAGSLYKAEQFASAVRFLKDATQLGVRALKLHEKINIAPVDGLPGELKIGKEDNSWQQLTVQLYKRWELLGVCLLKIGDRKRARESFIESIKVFPRDSEFDKSAFASVTEDILLTQKYKTLVSLIDRVTYISAAELFLGKETSLLIPLKEFGWPDMIIGLILNRQVGSLEHNRWKPEVQSAIEAILKDLSSIYTEAFPLHCAKVIARRIELAYYSDNTALNVVEMAEKAQSILSHNVEASNGVCERLLASIYLWRGLHAQKEGRPDSTTLIIQNATSACHVLRSLLNRNNKGYITRKVSKQSGGNSKDAGKINKENIALLPNRANSTKKQPTTPKMIDISLASFSRSPRLSANRVDGGDIAHDEMLFRLLCMTANLLGLLSLNLKKIEVLTIITRMSERLSGTQNEDVFFRAAIDLAHELGKVGKMEQAGCIFQYIWTRVRNTKDGLSEGIVVECALRYAEHALLLGDISLSSKLYREAAAISEDVVSADNGNRSTWSRARERVIALELAAFAAKVFAHMQALRGKSFLPIESLLKSLRLYNRAADTTLRVKPVPAKASPLDRSANPFDISEGKNSASVVQDTVISPSSPPQHGLGLGRSFLFGMEWRVAEGLLHTLFTLSRAYYFRGSPREAEYFIRQIESFIGSMHLPAASAQAIAQKCEVFLHMGDVQEVHQNLEKAADVVPELYYSESANLRRIQGDYNVKLKQPMDAAKMYLEAMKILGNMDKNYCCLDIFVPQSSLRRASLNSPRPSKSNLLNYPAAPLLLASILRQQIWLNRQNSAQRYGIHLEQLLKLPALVEVKTETDSLLAKLAFHDIHDRLRSDMSLNSLAESTIALPMPILREKGFLQATPALGMIELIDKVDQRFITGLESFKKGTKVPYIRDTLLSLVLVRAFQTALGRTQEYDPTLVCNILDISTSMTIRQEMSEAIHNKLLKLRETRRPDDLFWQPISVEGSPTNPRKPVKQITMDDSFIFDDLTRLADSSARTFLERLKNKYESPLFDLPDLLKSHVDIFPDHWVVVNMCVTEDKSTLIISRQRPHKHPIVFCIPLKHRRESNESNESSLTLEAALLELNDIIACSDKGTKNAVNIEADDQDAKAAWWSERKALDQRMKTLLDNIEFCWLGAFKTVLSPSTDIEPDALSSLRTRLEKVFKSVLPLQEKKSKAKLKLNDSILECIVSLPTNCRDEELEDLVYFILDLYHFNGISIALAEIDVDQVIVDLRTALEEFHAKTNAKITVEADSHIFLVLDKNLQGIPWESIPILRGKSVSRVPSIAFLVDRLQLARHRLGLPLWVPDTEKDEQKVDRIKINPTKTFFVLNPGGDLSKTEERFLSRLNDLKSVGWSGLVGQQPDEQQLLNALENRDLVIYFGHGGAEQYVRSHKLRHLSQCAATMLWGCSSGALRDMGDFDRVGTPLNYMLAGCPTLIANLWDVTDRDIDKFTLSVFEKLRLHPSEVKKWQKGQRLEQEEGVSVVAAVAQSRDACKLKYLTGAAPVVYGIPFYL